MAASPTPPRGFAAACVDLLNWDSERARLGVNARQLAVDRYDWAAIARRLFSRIQVAASREELPL
jgi:glycosyltransferase involved in cell wall biosynthesis